METLDVTEKVGLTRLGEIEVDPEATTLVGDRVIDRIE